MITTRPTFNEEEKLWKQGYDYIIGIDEVGRGSFAGPVTAAAVVFSKNVDILNLENVNDSKLLKIRQRETLSPLIKKSAFAWSISTVSVSVINKKGIGKATEIAFRKAVKDLRFKIRDLRIKNSLEIRNLKLEIPEQNIFVLVDGFHVKFIRGIGLKNQKAIIKGDQKSVTIAAASIIAKVHRDKIMKTLHKKYPNYHFSKNKGYGTKEHQKAIKKHGISKIHRTAFCKSFIRKNSLICEEQVG